MLTSANTSRTGESVLEPAVGQAIVYFEDLRVTARFLAPESEEADFVLIQIHFTTNQAAGPGLAERPGLPQQVHRALAVTAPEVDQAATRPLLQVELPVAREGPAVRGRLDPRRPLLEQRPDVPARVPLQVLQVFVPEAR